MGRHDAENIPFFSLIEARFIFDSTYSSRFVSIHVFSPEREIPRDEITFSQV